MFRKWRSEKAQLKAEVRDLRAQLRWWKEANARQRKQILNQLHDIQALRAAKK